MGFKTINFPTVEPVTIEDCRSHLHWDLDSDLDSETAVDEAEDALILDKLGAAREYAEGVTGLYLALRTVEMTLDRFPCVKWISLQGGPVRAVESISYLDENGDAQDMPIGDWSFNDYVTPARVDLGYQKTWPSPMRCEPNSIRIRYIVGYGVIAETPPDTLELPRDIKAALLLTMAHLLENKEDSAPIALESIPTGTLKLLSLKRENLGV